MNESPSPGLVASVADRLRNHARANGEDFQFILIRYGLERILYRLTQSDYSDSFLLKGALLFLIWRGGSYRPTKDLDLMSPEVLDPETLQRIFQKVCATNVVPDGLALDPACVRAEAIREDNIYGGVRANLEARLGKICIPIRIDTGFADSVTPEAIKRPFPTILDFPPPVVGAYPPETVVAEKFEAMVKLGMANSRMKDFYDLWILSREFEFEGIVLSKAIQATFERRRTRLPFDVPTSFTEEFFDDRGKLRQWNAFGKRAHIGDLPSAESMVACLKTFLTPPCQSLLSGNPFREIWHPGGPWKSASESMG